jgi:hypothetical protein
MRLACEQDSEVARLHELFASVGAEERPQPDISAAEWLRRRGASNRMLAVADACYANDFGCSLEQLGLSEMITENQRWDSGGTPALLLTLTQQHVASCLLSTSFSMPVLSLLTPLLSAVMKRLFLCLAGETYLVLDRSLKAVVQHLAAGLEDNMALEWPVHRIDYSLSGAKLFGLSGEAILLACFLPTSNPVVHVGPL